MPKLQANAGLSEARWRVFAPWPLGWWRVGVENAWAGFPAAAGNGK